MTNGLLQFASLVAAILIGRIAVAMGAQPRIVGTVRLSLSCETQAAGAHLTFTVTNIGAEDTALMPGGVLGNGTTYMVDGLTLVAKQRADGVQRVFSYRPRHYPAGIAGTVSQWIEPLPRGASFSMSAAAEDFVDSNRLVALPQSDELWLEWSLHAPRTETTLLAYWSKALQSNRLRFPGDCR